MTWEQTIEMINRNPEFSDLARDAYLTTDLRKNLERFMASEEFKETMGWMKKCSPQGRNILDIGCGNGISSIAFALKGYEVTSLEPDKSNLVGCGAILKLKNELNLENINIISELAENAHLQKNSFDIIYCRQSLHHALDLESFVKTTTRALREGGLWFSVRDHVIINNKDKEQFLKSHPLHKYYGGENAFTLDEYLNALKEGGIKIHKVFGHYDNVINYSPETKEGLLKAFKDRDNQLRKYLDRHRMPDFFLTKLLVSFHFNRKYGRVNSEKNIPGRLYTFIGFKI